MSEPVFWDRFRNRMVYEAKLVAATALRVGQGQESFEPSGSDLPVLRDPTERPFIPGSSLRGVVRAYVERVVRTLEPAPAAPGPWEGRGACDPLSTRHPCVPDKVMKKWREQQRQEGARSGAGQRQVAEAVWQHSCRVCRLFGSPYLASRVRFADLAAIDEPATVIRDGVSINRERETVENKYDFEVVEPGSAFSLVVVAENLEEVELGLLFLGIQALARGEIEVGGFKGRGLGRVRLEDPRLRRLDAGDRAALRAYLRSGEVPVVADATRQTGAWVEALLAHLEEATA